MHSSLVLLTLCSIILIIFMVTCFVCFIKSRRKEDEELIERVQYNNQQTTEQHNQHQQQQQQHQPPPQQQQYNDQNNANIQLQQQSVSPHRQKLSQSPSNNVLINDSRQQYQQRPDQMMAADYQNRNTYNVVGSPYHSSSSALGPVTSRPETRPDITQQINSAIIGSTEAEFQNDFIQVFPMYQITPMPEKNTTPYMT